MGVALAALLVPLIAMAIPGTGDMISIHSPAGREISDLYNLISKICLVILVIVEVVLFTAIFKFRRRSDDEMPAQIHGNLNIEIGWTVAAAIVQVYIGWVTIDVMSRTDKMPETEMTVEAIAYQWGWQFRYPDHGGMLSDDLVVPAHKNIKLEITSRDVIHSIFIPQLGVKMDAVPGRFNYWWFNADGPVNQVLADGYERVDVTTEKRVTTRPELKSKFQWLYGENTFNGRDTKVKGLEDRVTYMAQSRKVEEVSPYAKYAAVEYDGMCTEICGKGHWNMYFRTVAMTQSSFEEWVQDMQSGSGEVSGEAVYSAKCSSCHGADGAGSPPTFPPLIGTEWMNEDKKNEHIEVVLMGSKASTLLGDTTIAGVTYTGVMQPWGEVLNDAEVAAVVNHERNSWGNSGGEVDEKMVADARKALGLPPFPAGGAAPVPDSELMAEGENLYAACASCHGNDGKGLTRVPNLAGNTTLLSDVKATIGILVNGQDKPNWPGKKTAIGASLTDRQLSALLTYMRKSWGNDASAVTPSEVSRLRDEVKQ